MTELDPEVRRLAREEADTWDEVIYVSTFGTGLVAAFPTAIVAGGLLATPLGPLLFFGGLGFMGLRKRRAAKRKEDDPARDDYLESTVPDLQQLDVEPFGLDPLGRTTARLLDVVNRASEFELAMVLANERALGARRDGLGSTADARLDEASAFGGQATALNLEVELLTDALSRLLNDLPRLDLTAGQVERVHQSLPRSFYEPPPEQREVLSRIGVHPETEWRSSDPHAVNRSLRPGDNFYAALATALQQAGQKTGAFATAYRQTHGETGPALA
jgi:hypothetical protein